MGHENLNTPQNPPLQQTAVSGWRWVEVIMRLRNGKIATYKTTMQEDNKEEAIRLAKRNSWSAEVSEVVNVSFYACR